MSKHTGIHTNKENSLATSSKGQLFQPSRGSRGSLAAKQNNQPFAELQESQDRRTGHAHLGITQQSKLLNSAVAFPAEVPRKGERGVAQVSTLSCDSLPNALADVKIRHLAAFQLTRAVLPAIPIPSAAEHEG